MAETLTDKLKLSKRDTGDLNWGAGSNANLDSLDTHVQQKVLRPPRTLLASLGSGAVGANLLGSTIYFYKVTAINAAGETTESQIPAVLETQISEPSTPVPIILQWEIAKGATGYQIYKSTATGQEKFLASVTGESTLTYTDTGNTATNGSVSVPTQNTARMSVTKIVAGSGISVTPADGTGDVTVSAPTSGVTGIRALGNASALTGDVKLEGVGSITLTQDIPNNKIQIASSGGGAAGYATVVVAAPTGVAATDTSNIQTALNNAGTAGGGIVILREGTYNINASLSIPAKVTLAGQGRFATTLLGDPTFGASSMISASNANMGLRDLTIDENNPNRAGGSPFTGVLLNGTNALVENCQFTRNKCTGTFLFVGNGGQIRNCIITNNGQALATAMIQGGDMVEMCTLTQSQTGNVNDFIQSANQVVNCRLIRSSGTMSGAGIRLQSSQQIAVGNLIVVGSGNNAIIISTGTTGSVANGNVCGGAKITLEANANNAVVTSNSQPVITNNSGTATNQIANNS